MRSRRSSRSKTRIITGPSVGLLQNPVQTKPPKGGLAPVVWVLGGLGVLALAGLSAYGYLTSDAALKADRLTRPWYGNWPAATFSVVFFSAFVLTFLLTRRPAGWRHLGVAEAVLWC